jgi:hypothetical protein
MKKAPNHPFALGALALSLAALFTACSSKATPPSAESDAPAPLAEELKPLQGDWEGEGAGGKCSITIVGNSLDYRNAAGWYKTTFTLPAGAGPRQLHATIKECSPPSNSAIGTVVFAIFKIEDGTLLLGTYDGPDNPPTTFDDGSSRYTLKKVQPQKR